MIGDVASEARGSGARFNDGKPPLDLIPVRILAETWWRPDLTPEQDAVYEALRALADWQEGAGVGALYGALRALGAPMREAAAVLEYGRRKYAAWNWLKGMAWSVCVGCAARHAEAVLVRAEKDDPESGLPHVGHLACNLIFLAQFHHTYPEGDDRPAMLRRGIEASKATTVSSDTTK